MQTSLQVLDRVEVVFDDDNAVGNGGLVLPMSLAGRLGVRELVDELVDLGDAPGRANVGLKTMGLIASALAGGDSIDDADVLRSGRSQTAIGAWMPAPSTLGTFLRSFSWAHARQLDAVAGRLLARAWAAGGGPGDSPLIIDVDSTVCEVYGAKKQGARYGYTKTTPPVAAHRYPRTRHPLSAAHHHAPRPGLAVAPSVPRRPTRRSRPRGLPDLNRPAPKPRRQHRRRVRGPATTPSTLQGAWILTAHPAGRQGIRSPLRTLAPSKRRSRPIGPTPLPGRWIQA